MVGLAAVRRCMTKTRQRKPRSSWPRQGRLGNPAMPGLLVFPAPESDKESACSTRSWESRDPKLPKGTGLPRRKELPELRHTVRQKPLVGFRARLQGSHPASPDTEFRIVVSTADNPRRPIHTGLRPGTEPQEGNSDPCVRTAR